MVMVANAYVSGRSPGYSDSLTLNIEGLHLICINLREIDSKNTYIRTLKSSIPQCGMAVKVQYRHIMRMLSLHYTS